jgi:plastocyanin
LKNAALPAKLAIVKTLLVIALLFAHCAYAGAAIEGKVKLPAARGPAVTARYQTAVPAGPPDPPAAVVYLEGKGIATETNAVLEVGQKKYQFTPGLLPIQKGTMVKFPNHDDDYHNVFSVSKSKRFDLGKYRKDEEPATQKFDQAGAVKLFCDIHAHMRGTILVLETPYFVKTQKDGSYRLTDLPAGSYTLKAWVDEKVFEKPVELKNGETLKVDFTGK